MGNNSSIIFFPKLHATPYRSAFVICFFATASEEIIKKDRQHGGQIFLLIDNVQSKRYCSILIYNSGKLVQIEYALNAVNQGVTALGIKATNGIVLATEKKSSSPLIDPPSLSKVSLITPNIGMVYSGMGPDYRVLVDKARKVSHTGYKRIYNEYPPTRILVQDVARVMQEATQSGGVRPYGVSLLIAGWDEGIEPESEEAATADTHPDEKKVSGKTGGTLKGGPMLYQVDPSGSYFPWKATAIGK